MTGSTARIFGAIFFWIRFRCGGVCKPSGVVVVVLDAGSCLVLVRGGGGVTAVMVPPDDEEEEEEDGRRSATVFGNVESDAWLSP